MRRLSARQLEGLIADRSRLESVLFPSKTETAIDDDVFIDLDTAWPRLVQALVALNPALSLIEKGADLGTLFGQPARGFVSADARRIAAALSLITCERLDAPLQHHFDALKDFVTETAKAEAGMIVFWR